MPNSLEERVSSKCIREPIDRIRKITGTPPWTIYKVLSKKVGLHNTNLYRVYSGKQETISTSACCLITEIAEMTRNGTYQFPLRKRKKEKIPREPRRVSSECSAKAIDEILKKNDSLNGHYMKYWEN